MRRAVHERRTGDQAHAAVDGVRGDLVERVPLLAVVEAPSAERADEDVGLAPQHALGQPGRATGVEHVQVIGRPRRPQLIVEHVRRGGQHVLVPLGTVEQGVVAAVTDLQQDPEPGQPVADRGQRRGERRVVDDRLRARVAQQVLELLGHVAVVDVERREACLVRAEHAFDVLVAVVQVERQVVLTAQVVVEHRGAVGRRAFGHGAESPVDQGVRESTGPVADLGVGEASVAEDDALPIGHGRLDGLVHLSEVELQDVIPPDRRSTGGPTDDPTMLGPGRGAQLHCGSDAGTTRRTR